MKTSPKNQKNTGFISIILMVVAALVILYYLNIPLQHILSMPIASKIGITLKGLIQVLWDDFILLFQFIKNLGGATATSTPSV